MPVEFTERFYKSIKYFLNVDFLNGRDFTDPGPLTYIESAIWTPS